MTTEPISPPPDKPLVGAGITALIIAGLGISFVLFNVARIWIIPPVLPYTPLVYLLIWLPLWAFVPSKQRIGANLWRAVILFALVILPCCCVVYAPASGVGIIFEPWTLECIERDGDGSRVTYLCRSASYRMAFEGVNWLPFVRLDTLEGFDSVEPPPLPSE